MKSNKRLKTGKPIEPICEESGMLMPIIMSIAMHIVTIVTISITMQHFITMDTTDMRVIRTLTALLLGLGLVRLM